MLILGLSLFFGLYQVVYSWIGWWYSSWALRHIISDFVWVGLCCLERGLKRHQTKVGLRVPCSCITSSLMYHPCFVSRWEELRPMQSWKVLLFVVCASCILEVFKRDLLWYLRLGLEMVMSWCLCRELICIPVQDGHIPRCLVIFKDFVAQNTELTAKRNLFGVETPMILLIGTDSYLFRLIVLCWRHIYRIEWIVSTCHSMFDAHFWLVTIFSICFIEIV